MRVAVVIVAVAGALGAVVLLGDDPEPAQAAPAVTITPASAPGGTLLTFRGRGFEDLFASQGEYGRTIFLVRRDEAAGAQLVAKLRRARISAAGLFHEAAWVPGEFEVRPDNPARPNTTSPAGVGFYRFAIDTPDNVIAGATFELVRAEIGVAYRQTLSTHCGIERHGFDGSLWLADPPLDDGQGNPPPGWGNPGDDGTFTITAPDRAVFRSDKGKTVRFRWAPPGSVEPRPCA